MAGSCLSATIRQMPRVKEGWEQFGVGIDEQGRTGLAFNRREWDLGSDGLFDLPFSKLAPVIIKESRFHPTMFKPEGWIGNYHGGIIQAWFRVYKPVAHEAPGQFRQTATEDDSYWSCPQVGVEGRIIGYNPLEDEALQNERFAVGFGSRVMINNLALPGSFGGWAHFAMLDIVKPPTPENVQHLISEVKKRTGLEKFLVLRSSGSGMMVLGLELVDEEHLETFWNCALRMNHSESEPGDYWVDTNWLARSHDNFRSESGIPNRLQTCGILRMTAASPLKPEEPTVIAASF